MSSSCFKRNKQVLQPLSVLGMQLIMIILNESMIHSPLLSYEMSKKYSSNQMYHIYRDKKKKMQQIFASKQQTFAILLDRWLQLISN